MRVKVSTKVNCNYKTVFNDFELPLFKVLIPPQLTMEIIKFTGSRKGDIVHIKFLKPIIGEWMSNITEDGVNEREAYFIDEGTLMPFGITIWKHKHIISNLDNESCLITDNIYFETNNFFRSVFYLPLVWIGMLKRKKVYRKYFNHN